MNLRLLQVVSCVGAAYGLALAFFLMTYDGVYIFGLSLFGLTMAEWMVGLRPKVAPLPKELTDLKSRISNLEFKSGIKDRGIFTKSS